jgi:hypothetical protein
MALFLDAQFQKEFWVYIGFTIALSKLAASRNDREHEVKIQQSQASHDASK